MTDDQNTAEAPGPTPDPNYYRVAAAEAETILIAANVAGKNFGQSIPLAEIRDAFTRGEQHAIDAINDRTIPILRDLNRHIIERLRAQAATGIAGNLAFEPLQ